MEFFIYFVVSVRLPDHPQVVEMIPYAHATQQTGVCFFWDAYQMLGNDTHWMLPHSPVIFEIICGLDIVIHSAIVLWISDPRGRDPAMYNMYSWVKRSRIEQQINGVFLPFLM